MKAVLSGNGAMQKARQAALLLVAIVIGFGVLVLWYGKGPVEQYTAPDARGFLLTSQYDDDGNADGINETHIRRYRNPFGDKLFSMSSGGVLWAWSLDSIGDDDKNIDRNYVIRDSNCDGGFDERYAMDAAFEVPACVQ